MTEDVCVAVDIGQRRLARTASDFHQSCLEFALDELLRRPDRHGDPVRMLSAALAHARTHLRRRRYIRPIDSASHLLATRGSDVACPQETDKVIFELTDWVMHAPLPDRQRGLLLLATADTDGDVACRALRMSPMQLRQATSRARSAAKRCRNREAVAA